MKIKKNRTLMESGNKLLLTVREVAELLGVAPGTIFHWAAQGRLPCVRLSQRCLRFKKSEIEEWLNGLSVPAAEEFKRTRRKLRSTDPSKLFAGRSGKVVGADEKS
jgi:excisionase family DNA binding protein